MGVVVGDGGLVSEFHAMSSGARVKASGCGAWTVSHVKCHKSLLHEFTALMRRLV